MTDRENLDVRFDAEQREDLAGYRRVSRLALAALVGGALSALALASPLLWLLPPIAIVLAVAALRAISTSESELTGRQAAVWGLALALLFGGWATVRHVAFRQLLYRQARQYANTWFDLVLAGRLEEAHQLHLSPWERMPAGTSLNKYYAARPQPDPGQLPDPDAPPDIPAHDKLTWFFERPPLNTIVAHRQQGQVRLEQNLDSQYKAGNWRIVLRYRFDYTLNGQPQSLPFDVVFMRFFDADQHKATWEVQQVLEAGAPPGPM